MKNLITYTILTLLFVITATAQNKKPTPTPAPTVSVVSQALIQLEQKATFLTTMSETEARVSNYSAPNTVYDLTAESFLEANFMPSNTVISEADFDEFASQQALYDTRWTTLQTTMHNLFGDNVRLFRVGTTQIQYFAVSLYQGRIIGIRTYVVQT